MVGVKGLEPSTPWSQTRCATRLRYTPFYLLNDKLYLKKECNYREKTVHCQEFFTFLYFLLFMPILQETKYVLHYALPTLFHLLHHFHKLRQVPHCIHNSTLALLHY